MLVARSSAWPITLAAAIRVAIWFLIPDTRFASDEESYYKAGMQLLSSGEQDMFWPPATGWLIAGAAWLLQTTDIRWLRLVWIVLDIGCLLAIRRLARQVADSLLDDNGDRRQRFVTAATFGYAVYLPAIAFAEFTTSETPALLLTLIILAVATDPHATWRGFAAAGTLAGVLALTRPSVLPLLVFIPAAVVVAAPRGPRLVHSALFVLLGTMVVTGAVARNWLVTGELTIARNSAYNLYLGNRDFYAEDLDLFYPVATPAQIEFRRQYFGGELAYPTGSADELQREAFAWIASHPDTFARRALGRLARVFVPKTDVLELIGGEQGAGIFSARTLTLLAITNLQWAIVLFGGMAGLAWLWQRSPRVGVPFVFAVLGSLPLCLIAISKPRYAFVFEPVLLLSAGVILLGPRAQLASLGRPQRITLAIVLAFLIWAWVAWLVFAFSSRLALT